MGQTESPQMDSKPDRDLVYEGGREESMNCSIVS